MLKPDIPLLAHRRGPDNDIIQQLDYLALRLPFTNFISPLPVSSENVICQSDLELFGFGFLSYRPHTLTKLAARI